MPVNRHINHGVLHFGFHLGRLWHHAIEQRAGQCNPQEAVALFQLRMGSLLRKCRPHFEVIVIDTPPLLGLPDAMVVGRHADGTILSLMNEVSTLPAAQAACARLRTLNIPLLGAVLNAARVRTPVGY